MGALCAFVQVNILFSCMATPGKINGSEGDHGQLIVFLVKNACKCNVFITYCTWTGGNLYISRNCDYNVDWLDTVPMFNRIVVSLIDVTRQDGTINVIT